jgi:hypothetical protein
MVEIEQEYLALTSSAMLNVAKCFCREPESFLYERDLQSLLFARLFDGFAHRALIWRPSLGLWGPTALRRPLLLNPAKSQYPAGRLFDLALIAPDPDPDDPAWDLWVRVAIEIKLWQVAGSAGSRNEQDLDKLQKYSDDAHSAGRRFTGVSAVFFHDPDFWYLRELRERGVPVDPQALEVPADGIMTVAFAPQV